MKRIDYYNESGSVFKQAKLTASQKGRSVFSVIMQRILFNFYGRIARDFPPSFLRVYFQRLRGVTIGKRVFIGGNVSIDNAHPEYVTIEDDCSIAGENFILAHSNPKKHFSQILDAYIAPVVIKKGAWVAVGAMIMPGVTVGEFSIVSAGSVVTKDVPPYSVVSGNPAKILYTFPAELIFNDKI